MNRMNRIIESIILKIKIVRLRVKAFNKNERDPRLVNKIAWRSVRTSYDFLKMAVTVHFARVKKMRDIEQ